MDIKKIELREKVEKYKKYKIIQKGSNITKGKKELDYEYYVCDYCRQELKAGKLKWEERKGGILDYPITQFKRLKLALCNSCLKEAIKELDAVYKTQEIKR